MGVSGSALSSLLSACGGTSTNKPGSGTPARVDRAPLARGGHGRLGILVPTGDVDPVLMYDPGALHTAQICGEYLCFPDQRYHLQPRLATGWTSNADATEWTFVIRQGVKFHDGRTMTVDDVVTTFERLTDPRNNSSALSAFKGVLAHGQTRKVGSRHVRFHLQRPYVDFPYLVSAFNYNSIILPADYKIGTYTKSPTGTGPYRLQSYTAKQGASFVKNPDYWAPSLPYMDRVQLKYFDDTAPLMLALQGGAIDAVPQTPYQGAQGVLNDPNIVVLRSRSSEYSPVHMRVDQTPFKDPRVRQAIALSLDRPRLVSTLLGGNGEVGNDHPFAPVFLSSPARGSIAQRGQDYAQAKRLLAQAGHPRGLSVTLSCERNLEIPQYAVLLKQQCRPAGIDVNLEIMAQTAYYGSGDNQPWLSVPIGLIAWGVRGNAGQLIAPAYQCGGIWNSAHWCNAKFDRLMSRLDAELDEQRRQQIAAEAAAILHADVPAIVPYWKTELRTTRKNVAGLPNGPSFHLDIRGMSVGAT